jgi:hypothetical protein
MTPMHIKASTAAAAAAAACERPDNVLFVGAPLTAPKPLDIASVQTARQHTRSQQLYGCKRPLKAEAGTFSLPPRPLLPKD